MVTDFLYSLGEEHPEGWTPVSSASTTRTHDAKTCFSELSVWRCSASGAVSRLPSLDTWKSVKLWCVFCQLCENNCDISYNSNKHKHTEVAKAHSTTSWLEKYPNVYTVFFFFAVPNCYLYLLIPSVHPPLLYIKTRIEARITWLQEGFGT